jgi:hypothetical protein
MVAVMVFSSSVEFGPELVKLLFLDHRFDHRPYVSLHFQRLLDWKNPQKLGLVRLVGESDPTEIQCL